MSIHEFEVILANPRGFCAGVDRAITIVERAIENLGAPIYVRHEVVHNRHVVERLRKMGAVFVNSVNDVQKGGVIIFSAHGVSPGVKAAAEERGLMAIDATCPLVTKVHMEVIKASRLDEECVLIGHAGHPEVAGTLGHYQSLKGGIYLVESCEDVERLVIKNPKKLHYVTQTTLSVFDTEQIIEKLKGCFPEIQGPKRDDICYATQNRQQAVLEMLEACELILVVGAKNSSNSNRLCELALRVGKAAYLIEEPGMLNVQWLSGVNCVGVSAGASAPEVLVQDLVARLRELGARSVIETHGVEENVTFPLPKAVLE